MKVTISLDYDNYLFDLYGTLVDIHTDEEDKKLWKALAAYYRKRGAFYLAGGIKKKYHELVCEELKKAEEIQVEKVFAKLYQLRKAEVTKEEVEKTCVFFRETSTSHLRLYEWSIPILQELKENKKKIFLLSNAQRSFTMPEMKKLGLIPYFDKIYISSDYGVKKPNSVFYKTLIEEQGIDVVKSLMVGNDENCDIAGAAEMGMDTMYIHTNCSPEYTGKVKATYTFR